VRFIGLDKPVRRLFVRAGVEATGAFVVTAYDLRGKALAAYRRRRKQR